MNLSGESVLKIMSFYKIEKKDMIVVFDDVSLEF
jgi:peptidyl-tRNA hydrolase